MDPIEIVYLVCFFLGLGYAIISGLLSGVFAGGGEGAGNIDLHSGGVDAGGHHAGPGESIHLSGLINPFSIAMFIATFGGSGMLFKKYLGWAAIAHVPAAGAAALVVAIATFWLFFRVLGGQETSSAPRGDEAIGLDAQVTTPIPADGLGEIVYVLRESRYNGPARTVDGKPVAAQTPVKIVKIVGGTFYVDKAK